MANDMTNRGNGRHDKGSTLLTRALARFKEKQHFLKEQTQQAQTAKQAPDEQTLIEHCFCGETGEPFHAVWHRAHEGEQFRIREMVKDHPACTTGPPHGDTACATQDIPIESFDFSEIYCPCCGSQEGFVYCRCGDTVCGANRFEQDGQERFRHNKCGAEFALGATVKVISGHHPTATGKALTVSTGNWPTRMR